MTADEFEHRYAVRSGLTVAELRALGRVVRPCTCGSDDCDGWQSVSQEHAGEIDARDAGQVTLGSVDISSWVAAVPPEAYEDLAVREGLVSCGPVTISGWFVTANQRLCPLCNTPFVLQPDGPVPHVTAGNMAQPCCDRCAAAAIDGD